MYENDLLLLKYEENCKDIVRDLAKCLDSVRATVEEVTHSLYLEDISTGMSSSMELYFGREPEDKNEKIVCFAFKLIHNLFNPSFIVTEENLYSLWLEFVQQAGLDISHVSYRDRCLRAHHCKPSQIPMLMKQYLVYLYSDDDTDTPFLKAAKLHYQFVRISPFHSYNGFLSRLLLAKSLQILDVVSPLCRLYFSAEFEYNVNEYRTQLFSDNEETAICYILGLMNSSLHRQLHWMILGCNTFVCYNGTLPEPKPLNALGLYV